MGRRVDQIPQNYVLDNFRAWTHLFPAQPRRRPRRPGAAALPACTPVYSSDEVFDALEDAGQEERIAAYGVSVETCDEALTAIARPNVASVTWILNPFRMKPLRQVLPAAREAGVAIIARVPLASGLLSGKYTKDTVFAADDHRTYNRHGESFDQGETFSGVDFVTGVEAAAEFAALAPEGVTPAQPALRWIIQQPGVTTVIPGARSPEQAHANAAAAKLSALPTETLDAIEELITDGSRSRWRAAGSTSGRPRDGCRPVAPPGLPSRRRGLPLDGLRLRLQEGRRAVALCPRRLCLRVGGVPWPRPPTPGSRARVPGPQPHCQLPRWGRAGGNSKQ